MNEPTEQEINKAIAQWSASRGGTALSSYTDSHEACDEALRCMTVDESLEFCEICASNRAELEPDPNYKNAMRSTSRQKALAIYRVVKWEGR